MSYFFNNEQNRQRIIRIIRFSGILPFLEKLRMIKYQHISKMKNNEFIKANPSLKYPPLELMHDAYAHCDYQYYYITGNQTADFIINICNNFFKNDDITICEWGCGPARILQHIPLKRNFRQVIGTDYNQNTVDWCKSEFSSITFIKNNLTPPLLLDNHSIDFLYCISVFTHLSYNMQFEWIKEIKRVLKPGGVFLASFHGEKSVSKLLPEEKIIFNNGDLVVRDNVPEGSRIFSVYHPEKFIRLLFKDFQNVRKIDNTPLEQEVWIGSLI